MIRYHRVFVRHRLSTFHYEWDNLLDPGLALSQVNTVGKQDGFVVKLDSSGTFQWGQQIGSTGDEWAHNINVDSLNNVYVAGGFQATVDFDASSAVQNRSSAGDYDAFLLKLSSAGAYQWVKTWGSTGSDYAKGIFIDSNNNIKVGNGFNGTVDFDPGTNVYPLASVGGTDIAVSVFDTNGNFFGAQSIGQVNSGDDVWAMSPSPAGRPVLTGIFAGATRHR